MDTTARTYFGSDQILTGPYHIFLAICLIWLIYRYHLACYQKSADAGYKARYWEFIDLVPCPLGCMSCIQ